MGLRLNKGRRAADDGCADKFATMVLGDRRIKRRRGLKIPLFMCRPIRRDYVLAAARLLPQPFCKHALVVKAWGEYPREFGLGDFWKSFPNSNAVWAELYGKRGLVALGLLRVVKKDWFEVAA